MLSVKGTLEPPEGIMIAVVSHDAGGAEILSSWLRNISEPYCLVLDGPATLIFERKLGKCTMIPLQQAISESDWVMCGTSGAQSNLERQAIKYARHSRKKVVAFLDHWVNYNLRFLEDGVVCLPDEVWVGDREAKKIAQMYFEDLPIVLHPNPYFEELKAEFQRGEKQAKEPGKSNILYVCEPVRVHALHKYGDEHYWGYTEEEALQYFMENVKILGCEVNRIKVRPHPTESREKYAWVQHSRDFEITVGGDKVLTQEILDADIVVGCASMAMVVGLLAHKRVICSIPPGGEKCSLPHKEIEHLQELLGSNSSGGSYA